MRWGLKEPLAAKSTTLDVRALTHEERLAPVKAAIEATRGDGPVWDLEFFGEHLAYLRMPTFALYNSKWDWKGFLEKTFDEIDRRGVKNLAIDLRGNEGGLDVGDFILRRLIRGRIEVDEYRRLVRYRKVPASLEPYLDTWDPSFKDWGDQAVEPQGGFFQLRKFDDEGGNNAIEPSGRPFKGRSFVLVDAANSSATFQFAQVLQQNKLATLVGTPTGGNQRGINGGAFFFLRLPRSKIEVDIPLIGRFPAEEKPDAGLVPDILVEPRVNDITRGVDTTLAKVKDLASRPASVS